MIINHWELDRSIPEVIPKDNQTEEGLSLINDIEQKLTKQVCSLMISLNEMSTMDIL